MAATMWLISTSTFYGALLPAAPARSAFAAAFCARRARIKLQTPGGSVGTLTRSLLNWKQWPTDDAVDVADWRALRRQ